MYTLIDIGGTKIRLAFSKDNQTFETPTIIQTPQKFDEAIKALEEAIAKHTANTEITATAVGVAGPLNEDKSAVHPPNIPDWKGKPLKNELQRITGSDVFIENDTAMVGLGEIAAGAAQEYKDKIVAYLTISTGVGGTRIVNNKIDVSAFGFEPGHQFIDYNAEEIFCNCGKGGHLEGLTSGTAIQKKYGKSPKEVNDPQVWDEVAQILAYGLNNVTVFWSPHLIILGGSMMKDISVDAVSKYLRESNTIFEKLPEVKKAELEDIGGLHGCLSYLQTKAA